MIHLTPFKFRRPLANNINTIIYDLPAPLNISYLRNFGSLLTLCLLLQIFTGLLLTIHYIPNISLTYRTFTHIRQEINIGLILKYSHTNGASIIFIIIYLHIARRIYFKSFKTHPKTWIIGIIIYIFAIAIAFTGHLLPWREVRYWGATVITNMFSAIPYIGSSIATWLWAGVGVSRPTLRRFFSLHFLIPIILVILVLLHLIILHQERRSNPLGGSTNANKVPFHPFYTIKDLYGILTVLLILTLLSLILPNTLTTSRDLFNINSLSNSSHIKPEWYFLWLYAILRSFPNKLGGILFIFAAIFIFFILPYAPYKPAHLVCQKFIACVLFSILIILTWIGYNPVGEPYIYIGPLFTCLYFVVVASEMLPPFKPIK